MHPISKKKVSGKKRRVSKKGSDAALVTALEIVSRAHRLKLDVYESVVQSLQDYDESIDQITSALDPKSVKDASALLAARLEFSSKIDAALAKDFQKLGDLMEDFSFWRETGSFFLGLAVGATLVGNEVRR